MYDLRVAPPRSDRILAWKPPVPGVREVFHARFAEHAYPPHTHDTWTLFIVDDGAIRYDLDRHPRGAGTAAIGILPPGVVHDGRPATDHGFTKRVIYLETSVLGDDLIGHAVDRPLVIDPTLRIAVSNVHRVLGSEDALEAETRLAFIAERLRSHLGARTDQTPGPNRTNWRNSCGHFSIYISLRMSPSKRPGLRWGRALPTLPDVSARRSESLLIPTFWVVGLRHPGVASWQDKHWQRWQSALAFMIRPTSLATSSATLVSLRADTFTRR